MGGVHQTVQYCVGNSLFPYDLVPCLKGQLGRYYRGPFPVPVLYYFHNGVSVDVVQGFEPKVVKYEQVLLFKLGYFL